MKKCIFPFHVCNIQKVLSEANRRNGFESKECRKAQEFKADDDFQFMIIPISLM